MKSTERQTKRAGTRLQPDEIDKQKLLNDHRRKESFKDGVHNIKMISMWVAATAIPAIYLVLLCVNWSDAQNRNATLQEGLVAVIAFALGKVDFNFGASDD